MKIELFDVAQFIDLNHLKEITSPILFQRGSVPDPDGLISNEIFGVDVRSRKGTFAYISLNGHFFHPHIYKTFKRFYRNIERIINGDFYYSIDKDGNMTAINADITGKIKATTLDCTNATVQGLEVGKNITMGANAVISWSQVTGTDNVANKSDIPTSTSELTNNSGFAYTYQIPSDSEITQITNNAISTAQISANQITSGT